MAGTLFGGEGGSDDSTHKTRRLVSDVVAGSFWTVQNSSSFSSKNTASLKLPPQPYHAQTWAVRLQVPFLTKYLARDNLKEKRVCCSLYLEGTIHLGE